MEYDAEIYMLVNRTLPGKTQFSDITIFKDEMGYWCIGEDPACLEKWVAMYAPGQKPYTRILHNAGIKFMSQVIYIYDKAVHGHVSRTGSAVILRLNPRSRRLTRRGLSPR